MLGSSSSPDELAPTWLTDLQFGPLPVPDDFIAEADRENDSRPRACPSIPGYELLEEIGRGGMGVVYRSRHIALNRIVALKIVHGGFNVTRQDRIRFRQEAEAIAALKHPNIVQVYEIGEHELTPYLSLEYVEGGTLQSLCNGKPLPYRDAAWLMEQVARGISAAHEQNIIHRDLKPANILLCSPQVNTSGNFSNSNVQKPTSDPTPHPASWPNKERPKKPALPTPKITDFGLAKRLDQGDNLTVSGVVAGTPQYMAPEQALGYRDSLGPAVDIHAVGILLYELLTGRGPFIADSPLQSMDQVVKSIPISPRQLLPHIPRDLETICLKCLDKNPAKRYFSALELAEDLARFQRGEPIVARPLSTIGRGIRWCRRNPFIAGSISIVTTSLLLCTIAAIGMATYAWKQRDLADANASEALTSKEQATIAKQDAEHQRAFAVKQRDLADANASEALRSKEQATIAKQDAERQRAFAIEAKQRAENFANARAQELYTLQINLAQKALEEGHYTRLRDLLRKIPEGSDTQPELRNFEYYFLTTRRPPYDIFRTTPAGSGTVAISPEIDPKTNSSLQVWSGSNTIEIYSPYDAARKHVRLTHPVEQMSISNDGQKLAYAGADKVTLRELKPPYKSFTLDVPAQHIRAVRLHPTSGWLVISARQDREKPKEFNNIIAIWNLQRGDAKPHVIATGTTTCGVDFIPGGTKLVYGAEGMPLKVVELSDYSTSNLDQLGGHEVLSTHRHKQTAIATAAGPVLLVDFHNPKVPVRQLIGPRSPVTAMAFSPTSDLFAAGTEDGKIYVWSTTNGILCNVLQSHRSKVTGLSFHINQLYSSSASGSKLLWHPLRKVDNGTIELENRQVVKVIPMKDHLHALLLTERGEVGKLNLDSKKTDWLLNTKPGDNENGASLAILGSWLSPDNSELQLYLANPNVIRRISLADSSVEDKPWPTAELPIEVLTKDGRMLICRYADHTVRLLNRDQPSMVHPIGRKERTESLQLHPNKPQLAIRYENQLVCGYDLATGRELWLKAFPYQYGLPISYPIRYSPDGTLLAVGTLPDQSVGILDSQTGAERYKIPAAGSPIQCMSISPDNKRIAVIGPEHSLELFDTLTRSSLLNYRQSNHKFSTVEFTPDGLAMLGVSGNVLHVCDGAHGYCRSEAERVQLQLGITAVNPLPPELPDHEPGMAKLRFEVTFKNTSDSQLNAPTCMPRTDPWFMLLYTAVTSAERKSTQHEQVYVELPLVIQPQEEFKREVFVWARIDPKGVYTVDFPKLLSKPSRQDARWSVAVKLAK
jgi:serine/threonine protein kinase/WD40 repeat protein